jgi:Flp pilus assembly pilin Flp
MVLFVCVRSTWSEKFSDIPGQERSNSWGLSEQVGVKPMLEFAKTWLELKTDKRAVTALEYGLIAGAIVAVILVGFNVLAGDLSAKFNAIGGSL